MKKTSKTRDAGGEELRSSILTSLRDTATRSNGFKVIRTRARPISARVASMGDLLCLFTGEAPSRRGLTVNRHSKSPIDATRTLIGRALVLMTLNPFERVVVSLKLVSMLLHYSSPPASLGFAVFSCEQILKRPLRMELEL